MNYDESNYVDDRDDYYGVKYSTKDIPYYTGMAQQSYDRDDGWDFSSYER